MLAPKEGVYTPRRGSFESHTPDGASQRNAAEGRSVFPMSSGATEHRGQRPARLGSKPARVVASGCGSLVNCHARWLVAAQGEAGIPRGGSFESHTRRRAPTKRVKHSRWKKTTERRGVAANTSIDLGRKWQTPWRRGFDCSRVATRNGFWRSRFRAGFVWGAHAGGASQPNAGEA